MEVDQRSPSLPSALIRRVARLSFFSVRSASSIAVSLARTASLNCSSRVATLAFKSATLSSTSLSTALADSSCAFASASSCLLGSTIITTSKYATMLMAQSHP